VKFDIWKSIASTTTGTSQTGEIGIVSPEYVPRIQSAVAEKHTAKRAKGVCPFSASGRITFENY